MRNFIFYAAFYILIMIFTVMYVLLKRLNKYSGERHFDGKWEALKYYLFQVNVVVIGLSLIAFSIGFIAFVITVVIMGNSNLKEITFIDEDGGIYSLFDLLQFSVSFILFSSIYNLITDNFKKTYIYLFRR